MLNTPRSLQPCSSSPMSGRAGSADSVVLPVPAMADQGAGTSVASRKGGGPAVDCDLGKGPCGRACSSAPAGAAAAGLCMRLTRQAKEEGDVAVLALVAARVQRQDAHLQGKEGLRQRQPGLVSTRQQTVNRPRRENPFAARGLSRGVAGQQPSAARAC